MSKETEKPAGNTDKGSGKAQTTKHAWKSLIRGNKVWRARGKAQGIHPRCNQLKEVRPIYCWCVLQPRFTFRHPTII